LDEAAVNVFRRLSLYRLLLLCSVVIAAGASLTALALAVDSGPKPPAKPLAQAVHDALSAPAVQGVSANIKLTDHLLEGAEIASGDGQGNSFASNPLLTGASGRLWVASDGRVRLELQAEKGDTQILYDGSTVSVYDASTNTLYRYKIPPDEQAERAGGSSDRHEVPSVAKIEEGIARLSEHALLSGATPANVAGQPAYTVRLSPKEGGSLIGGAELSFDAAHGVPLRAAVYSSKSSAPVLELAATEISYGPVDGSVFSFSPPAGVKLEEITIPESSAKDSESATDQAGQTKLSTHGHGVSAIELVEHRAADGERNQTPEGLPQVDINGTKASELRTALGTVLSFERSGVRYLVAGALDARAIETFARGL